MKKTIRVILAVVLVLTMLCSVAACAPAGTSSAAGTASTGASSAAGTASGTTSTGASSEEAKDPYAEWPTADDKVTLEYWVTLSGNAQAGLSSYNDHSMYKEMEKITGIKMEFTHPADAAVDFNLMIVSDPEERPDLVEHGWAGIDGGPQKYIDDGVILQLDELLEKYAPDALNAMTQTEIITKLSKTDGGHFYVFNCPISTTWDAPNANIKDKVQAGPIVRADWLKDLGLDKPENFEDWEEMLTKFKDEKGATAPIAMTPTDATGLTVLTGMFDTYREYYARNGKVVFGPYEENYKAFLQAMNKWFEAGLLDPDFAANDGAAVKAKMLNSKAGVIFGYTSTFTTYIDSSSGKEEGFDLTAVTYPDRLNGEKPLFMARSADVRTSGYCAIMANCEYPEWAAKYMNHFYTEDGMLLKNFGVKDVAWEFGEDGSVLKTELLTKNPDGLSAQQALGVYSRGDVPAPGYLLKTLDLVTKTLGNERVLEAYDTWLPEADNCDEIYLPTLSQTPEEALELSQYNTNINTYVNECRLKFIVGTMDIDTEWDAYIAQLKTLGIETVLELKQAAYERYLKR